MTLEIGEDAFFRPDSGQLNDYYASVRQLVPPEDDDFYYTTRAKVETRLLTPTNREAAFDADFGDILTDCIRTAEAQLEEYLGRDFRQNHSEQTLSLLVRSEMLIKTPDIRGDRTFSVATGTGTLGTNLYSVGSPYFPRYDVRKNIRPLTGWSPNVGDYIVLTFTPGWPVVPPPIVEAATRGAAEIYRAGELSHGIVETGGIPIYARMPMKGIVASLRPFRSVSV